MDTQENYEYRADQATADEDESLLDELTYRSYRHNRKISPEVTPERWTAIFPKAVAFERRLQRESNAA